MGRILASALVPLVCAACAQEYPLPRAIACDAVLAIRIGMTEEEVITRIGSPQYVIREKQFLQDGTPIDTYAMYGRPYHPEYMRYWDQFDVGYAHGKVVYAVALRLSDGGVRQPALTLRSTNNDARPSTPPQIGPAFESVFDCHDAEGAPK